MKKPFDGESVRSFLNDECNVLLSAYRQFEKLLPSDVSKGASHRGEDGRYIESLVKLFLKSTLPCELEVSSGFILRPATKTGIKGKERRGEKDRQSKQIDIIIHNSSTYPTFQRFENNVIVPPEGVVAIISIKKHLRNNDVQNECKALHHAANLCKCLDTKGIALRGPFLALLGMSSLVESKVVEKEKWIFSQINEAYHNCVPTFDEVVGYVGTLDEGSVFKKRPNNNPTTADFLYFSNKDINSHFALQFILTGILSVYYDPTRNSKRRPGFSAFPSGKCPDKKLGNIKVSCLR